MASVTVATWNLLSSNGADRALDYLERATWDIACLQEVRQSASPKLAEREDWDVVDGLLLAPEFYATWERPHAAALVARNGWKLSKRELVPNSPKPGRAVRAVAEKDGDRLSVISWHAPNARGETAAVKMAGYRAIVEAIGKTKGPLVLGFDSNHWSLSTELELAPHDPDVAKFAEENQFFGSDPQHRLRDALLDWLKDHPEQYKKRVRLRPSGPLEITYKRGSTYDRFDYLMVSDELRVREMTHDFKGATSKNVGSDHAFVSALLELD